MDFMNRGAAQPAAPTRMSTGGETPSARGRKSSWHDSPQWLRIVWIVLLFSVTVLVVSLVALLYFGGPNEAKYLDSKKQQAVFLTNGQVYFGKIKAVNAKYIDLQNIYYLNVNQQVQPDQKNSTANQQSQSSVSLVKLGCELHGPADRMVINRDQVTFWENLKDDGQVAKAIAEWVKQNPNGQTCQTTATNTNGATTNSKP